MDYKCDNIKMVFTVKDLIITENIIYGHNICTEIYKLQRKLNRKKHLTHNDYINIKRLINESINTFIKSEAPKQITTCNINRSFLLKYDLLFNKYIINYLQNYIRSVFQYKLKMYNIKLVLVNEAYIDKVCSWCLSLNTNTTQ